MLQKSYRLVLILLLAISMVACQLGSGNTPVAPNTEPTQASDQPKETQPAGETQPTDSGLAAPTQQPESAAPANGEIILATTGFTEETGILKQLINGFTEKTGIAVRVVTRVNPNQVLEMGYDGQADVLLSHAPLAEASFEEKGYAAERRLVMHNDFIIVGPAADPAGVASSTSAHEALSKILNARAPYATRGDNSVIYRLEIFLWQKAKVKPTGDWYFETLRNMSETLTMASERGAYTLTDRASFLTRRDSLNLAALYQGDLFLLNYYHAIVVSPEKYPALNTAGARLFAEYLVSPEAQKLIAEYNISFLGEATFFADGNKTDAELGLPEADTDD